MHTSATLCVAARNNKPPGLTPCGGPYETVGQFRGSPGTCRRSLTVSIALPRALAP